MKISGKTDIYALIGSPVEHTASCSMHNAAFRKFGIDGVYVAFKVSPKNLKKAIEGIRSLNIKGVNITIPHKEECLKYLDKVTPAAKAIGAVNTILNEGGKLIGFNTDALGFIDSLKFDVNFNPSGKKVFIMGAGGASRAVSFALAGCKAKSITLLDIKNHKAKKLASSLKAAYKDCDSKHVFFKDKDKIREIIKSCNLLVNATGLGLKKEDPLPVDSDFLHKGLLVCDLIYNPKEPIMLRVAKKRGIKTLNGQGLLVYQGIRAFKIWTGKNIPVKLYKAALENFLKNKK